METSRSDHPVLHPELTASGSVRWPLFGTGALDAGVHTVFAFPLRVGAVRIGALDATARGDQYAHIETRLVDEYGPRRGVAVRHVIAEERGRFADARIHAFVPILVERSVRTRLGTARLP